MNECTLCPRMCHARRTPEGGNGFCGLGSTMRLATAVRYTLAGGKIIYQR